VNEKKEREKRKKKRKREEKKPKHLSPLCILMTKASLRSPTTTNPSYPAAEV
jgi:hypothetical protein